MLRSFMTVLLSGAGALWALTGGPSQPEYTGFTPSQKTDLVDLYTGDFSYSIPLLSVPGPSMNYPIVLGYRGGITNEQASSWVGLGWSLNPGAINRTLNRYPDDYINARSVDVLSGSEVVSAWDVGVSYMGIGLSVGQRSDHGWHGGLEIGMDGVDVQLSLDQKDGFGIQPPAMIKERFEGMITGAITGAASSALDGASNELLGSEGIGLSTSVTAHSLSVSVNGVGFGSSSVSSGAFHDVSHSLSIPVGNTGFVVSFSSSRAWLHKVEDVKLFGYLNLSRFPKENTGGTHFDTKDAKMEYSWAPDQPTTEKGGNSFESWFMDLIFRQKAFATSTPDGYQARAEGMSMSFRPYRQDIGDYYGQERLEARVGYWLNLVNSTWLAYLPFFGHMTTEQKERYDRQLGENATQFVDQSDDTPANQKANYYLNYQSTSHQYPVTVFREMGTSGGAFLGETWRDMNLDPTKRCTGYECDLAYRHRTNGLDTEDQAYKLPYILKPTSGEYPDRISGGSGVFPVYKNEYDADGKDSHFTCNVTPDIPQCDPAVPKGALIGFTLVRPDGMVYEYLKPVFNWNQKVASLIRPEAEKTQGAYDFGDIKRTSSMYRAYATSWLLTAIKSPDYVDLGPAGLGDEDIGSWVSFEYGHHIPRFSWRTPYEGSNPIGVGKDEHLVDGSDLTFLSYGQASWGSKEIYFLSAIRTPSHEARFISSLKDQNDGAEAKLSDEAGVVDPNRISVDNLSPEIGDHVRIKYTVTSPDGTQNHTCSVHTDYNEEFDIASVVTGKSELNADNGIEASHVAALDHAMHSSSCGDADIHRVEILSRQHPENHMMRKLDRIELYRRDNNSLISAVDFGYETVASKQLATGVPDVPGFDPSSDSLTWKGKLTLRQVTIGDGNVQLPPYNFSYYMEGHAAPYKRMHFDRWGYYKHNGGLVNTDFLKGNVVDWDFLLQILKGQVVPPAPIGSFSATVLRNALLQSLDQADVTGITNSASGAALRDGYKVAIVKALNRVKDGLTFYTGDRALPSPHLPKPSSLSDDFKSNTWASRAMDLGLINSNGVLVKNISLMSEEEKNVLRGLNMTVLSRYLYYQESPKKLSLFRDFAINHFDHETDPNDVKAWSLKQVSLPSGGKIDVEYESDDYVYLGKTRAMDLADADKFMAGGGLDYFQNIGQEKSSYSSSGLLKFDEGLMGDSYWENPDKVQLRVASLFHIFRKKKDGTGWEYTPPFAKLKKWVDAGKNMNDPKYRLHLLGWYSDLKVNQNIFTGGNCGDGTLVDQNGDSPGAIGYLAPFDIGSVVQAFDLTDGNDAFKEAHQCQRNYVDFDLTKFVAANLEAANKFDNVQDPCGTLKSNPKLFLQKIGFLTLGWARAQDPTDYTDWPLFIPIQSAPAANVHSDPVFKKYVDLSSPRFNHLPNLSEMYSTNPSTTSLLLKPCNTTNPARPDGCTLTYPDGGEWKGPARWDALSEFSTHYADDSWGFMSFNVGKRVSGGDPVAMAAGIPGGGLRVKRLSFNSGWPQRAGEPPQTQVTDYAYTCSASKGGLYSSGATASIPPPYNNKGDDRVPLPPEASLVEGAPSVGYRKVTEIRPGRGEIVYDFLSPADVYDFIGYENCNQVKIENGFITGRQAGCYDKDDALYWSEMSHARWKLNRMAQFQGLMIGKSKLSEKKPDGTMDTVASEKYRFLTSLSNEELGELSEAALLNNSDAFGSTDALIGTNDAQISAGSRDYQFRRHPTSDFMGQTIERMRLRWYFKQDDPDADEVKDKIGLNEMEIVEHSIRQCEVISKTQGVGTRTRHAFYDFLTGEPVVSVTSALKKGDLDDPSLPTKTTVTVPAHWVPEYNPPTATEFSMGSIYDDPNFFNLATGNLNQGELKNITGTIRHRNMLTQSFSQSVYSDLASFYSTCPADQTDCPEWWTLLNGTNILNRKITTWDVFGQGGTVGNAWRMSKTLNLRLPMEKATAQGPIRVNVDRGTLNYPFPAQGSNIFDEYLTNEAYVTENSNTQYGDLGEVLESQDAYSNSVSSFYEGHKMLVGQVLNSDRASCAITSMDEWAHESPPSDTWTLYGGASVTDEKARSGTYSLSLPSSGDKLSIELTSARPGKYELSVWTKQSAYALGAYAILVRGEIVNLGLLSYDTNGPEWQRTVIPITVDFISLTADIQVELSHVPAPGQVWLDDMRLAPADAQVFSMTYDNRGYRSSQSDPNDMLMRFDYDAFGRLTEVRDGQGVLVSTQAQLEAK